MKHSDKTKNKISETKKRLYAEGKLISPFKGKDFSGVNNPMYGKSHSEKTRKKLSESIKKLYRDGKIISPFKGRDVNGENNPMYGRAHSTETRIKISETRKKLFAEGKIKPFWKGKHLLKNARDKLSETRKRLYQQKILIPSLKNKTFSDIHKNRISIAKKKLFETGKIVTWNKGMAGEKAIWYGKKHTQETKNKMKESRKYQTKVFTSKQELKIQNFLKLLTIDFIPHRYMSEIIHGYQCDIFIPSLNLVIECDGDYWHGHPIKYPNPNQMQKEQIEEDKIRTLELKEKGFKVLRLWQKEINYTNLEDLKLIINKIKNND